MINFLTPIIPHPIVKENYPFLRGCDRFFSPFSLSKYSLGIISHSHDYNTTLVESRVHAPRGYLRTTLKIATYLMVILPPITWMGKLIFSSPDHMINHTMIPAIPQLKIATAVAMIFTTTALVGKLVYRSTNHFVNQRILPTAVDTTPLNKLIESLNKSLAKSLGELKTANDENGDLTRDVFSLEEQLRKISSRMTLEIETLKSQLILKQSEKIALTTEIQILTETLHLTQQDLNNAKRDKVLLLGEKCGLHEELRMKSDAISEHVKEFDKLKTVKEKLTEQLKKTETQLVGSESQGQKTQFNLNNLQGLSDRQVEKIRSIDLNNIEKDVVISRLMQTIEYYESPSFWIGNRLQNVRGTSETVMKPVSSSNSIYSDDDEEKRSPTPSSNGSRSPSRTSPYNDGNDFSSPRHQEEYLPLDKYLEKHCPGYTREIVTRVAQAGHLNISKILTGELTAEQFNREKGDIELLFTQITWYLMLKADEKKQLFYEGSFTTEDQEGRLIQFLKHPSNKYDEKTKKGVYSRWSSHLKGVANDDDHLGLDIHKTPVDLGIEGAMHVSNALPANKKTLLLIPFLSKNGEKQLFIKPENHGLSFNSPTAIYESTKHMLDWAYKATSRMWDASSDHEKGMNKERIPAKAVADFMKTVTICFSKIEESITSENINELKRFLRFNEKIFKVLKLAELYGSLSDMLPDDKLSKEMVNITAIKEKFKILSKKYLEACQKQVALNGCQSMVELSPATLSFDETLLPILNTYKAGKDNQERRFWNEVVLSVEDLMSGLKPTQD